MYDSSLDGTVTWFDDKNPRTFGIYFRLGLPSKEYYKKYLCKENLDTFVEIPLFSPDLLND